MSEQTHLLVNDMHQQTRAEVGPADDMLQLLQFSAQCGGVVVTVKIDSEWADVYAQ